MWIYDGRKNTYSNTKEGIQIHFEAGATLDAYSIIFARMMTDQITVEEGWDLFKLERACSPLTVRDIKESIADTLNGYVKEGILKGSGLEDK